MRPTYILLEFGVLSLPFLTPVWAKNWGPRAFRTSSNSARNPEKYRAQLSSPRVVVPETHVFYDNYAKDFSWFNETERRASFQLPEIDDISSGVGNVRSRDLTPAKNTLPDNCLGCSGGGNPGQKADISWLTTQYFQGVIQAYTSKNNINLQNTCLFYSAIYTPNDLIRYLQKYSPFPSGVDPALSATATNYACSNNLFTIWMIYPGQSPTGENPNQQTDTTTYNYFEMYTPGSWLAPVLTAKQAKTYFQNMSEAMANICGGIIRVLSEDPTNLAKYDTTIWYQKEYPALYARFNGGANSPTELISIDANYMELQYKWTWAKTVPQNPALILKRQLSQDDPDYWWGWNETITSRSTCNANVAYETASGLDWFG
ncbi:hypothetical protein BX600DRAFT_505685 [Xylariales sp. PMI_506]|nr:hypothetical protein BX600DRAFT_505685 [Xylariales sp. PMI_506]